MWQNQFHGIQKMIVKLLPIMASLASSQRFEASRKWNEVDWILFLFLPRTKLKKQVDMKWVVNEVCVHILYVQAIFHKKNN